MEWSSVWIVSLPLLAISKLQRIARAIQHMLKWQSLNVIYNKTLTNYNFAIHDLLSMIHDVSFLMILQSDSITEHAMINNRIVSLRPIFAFMDLYMQTPKPEL